MVYTKKQAFVLVARSLEITISDIYTKNRMFSSQAEKQTP